MQLRYYESLGDIYANYGLLDLRSNHIINMIDAECNAFLYNRLDTFDRDIRNFSYDLKYDKRGDKVTIIADNLICALWFIGIFPKNCSKVLEENRFETTKNIYTFDKKNLKLKRKSK